VAGSPRPAPSVHPVPPEPPLPRPEPGRVGARRNFHRCGATRREATRRGPNVRMLDLGSGRVKPTKGDLLGRAARRNARRRNRWRGRCDQAALADGFERDGPWLHRIPARTQSRVLLQYHSNWRPVRPAPSSRSRGAGSESRPARDPASVPHDGLDHLVVCADLIRFSAAGDRLAVRARQPGLSARP
jgi:hypothetical protein